MLSVVGGSDAIDALNNGAAQRAYLHIYDAYTTGHPQLLLRTNTHIISDSLTVQKAGISGDKPDFGAAISDELNVSVRRVENGTDVIANYSLLGQTVRLEIEWEYDGTYSPESLIVFTGLITEVNQRGDVYEITALDGLIGFDKPFISYDLLDPDDPTQPMLWPISPYNLVRSIVLTHGAPYVDPNIIIVSSTLVNTGRLLDSIDESQGYTCRQVLRWCAQIMGCSIRVAPSAGRTLELYLNEQTAQVISGSNAFALNIGKANANGDSSPYTVDIISGTKYLYTGVSMSANRLVIADNPFLDQMAPTTVQTIGGDLETMAAANIPVQTISCKAQTVSMWYLEPFDIVQAVSGGQTYDVIVTSVTHKLNGSSVITSDMGTEASNTYSPVPAFNTEQTNYLVGMLQNLCFSAGDEYNPSVRCYCYGFLTTLSTTIVLIFPLPKMIPPNLTITVTSLIIRLRLPQGGYVESNGYDATSYINGTYAYGNCLFVRLTKNTKWMDDASPQAELTNNIVITGQVEPVIKFS